MAESWSGVMKSRWTTSVKRTQTNSYNSIPHYNFSCISRGKNSPQTAVIYISLHILCMSHSLIGFCLKTMTKEHAGSKSSRLIFYFCFFKEKLELKVMWDLMRGDMFVVLFLAGSFCPQKFPCAVCHSLYDWLWLRVLT